MTKRFGGVLFLATLAGLWLASEGRVAGPRDGGVRKALQDKADKAKTIDINRLSLEVKALRFANASVYGLTASIYTSDAGRLPRPHLDRPRPRRPCPPGRGRTLVVARAGRGRDPGVADRRALGGPSRADLR